MKKILLSVIMMTSILVLASCEERTTPPRVGSSRVNKYVTGSVVTKTPIVVATGTTETGTTETGATESITATASVLPMSN